MFKKIINHFKNDHLYRNSIYLILSTTVMAGLGFFFWLITARLFPTREVGIATTLVSLSTLLSSFTLLGLNISLNRFLPKSEEKNKMISSTSILVIIASIIITVIFLIGINIFSPKLSFLGSNLIYISTFIFFIVVFGLNGLFDSVYVAYRASGNILFKNIIFSILKILFIFGLISFGAYGIFSSYATAMVISFFISLGVLIYRFEFRPQLKINFKIIQKMAKFSAGNYISGFLYSLPSLLLPIIIINKLSATTAAYYYMDSMILGFLITIPLSTSQSLLTEGSHDETLTKKHLKKAIKITSLLLLPSVIIIFFFGNIILQFFGKSYASDAFRFLQIISLSVAPMAVVLFGNSVLRIRHKIKELIILNFVGCIITLGASYLLITGGLFYLGIGWLIGQTITSGIYLIILNKFKLFNSFLPLRYKYFP